MEDRSLLVLKAKWIAPVDTEPFSNGGVILRGHKIEALVRKPAELARFADHNTIDYGDAILVPGFINLHTHLEYSALLGLAPDAKFFDWVKALVHQVAKWQPSDWLNSARLGAKLAAQAGTTCLVDSSYTGNSAKALTEVGLRGVVGLELFGVNEQATEAQWTRWLARYETAQQLSDPQTDEKVQWTVAPHAPYTVSPALWRQANEWAQANGKVLVAHIAESPEERRWLAHGDERVDEHLRFAFRLWRGAEGDPVETSRRWRGIGLSPVAHLRKHGLLNKNLLAAHMVEVDQEDCHMLAEGGVNLAHCPRSNARLLPGRAPVEKWTDAGIEWGFGTDSLACVHSLNLLDEARFAVLLHRAWTGAFSLDAKSVLYRLTLGAARAINMDNQIGSLTPGKAADIAVFRVNSSYPRLVASSAEDAAELLVHGNVSLCDLYVDGTSVPNSSILPLVL